MNLDVEMCQMGQCLLFVFSFYCLNRWSHDKMYGNQSYSIWFGAPKTLDVLIERVVPLLNDGYQNKPFGGVWTPNGAFLTLCSFHIFVRESLCLSVVSFFYIKLETTCRSILHAYPKLVKFPLFQTSEISLVVTNSPCHWKFTKIYWKIMTTCLWILLRFTNFNKSSTEISIFFQKKHKFRWVFRKI